MPLNWFSIFSLFIYQTACFLKSDEVARSRACVTGVHFWRIAEFPSFWKVSSAQMYLPVLTHQYLSTFKEVRNISEDITCTGVKTEKIPAFCKVLSFSPLQMTSVNVFCQLFGPADWPVLLPWTALSSNQKQFLYNESLRQTLLAGCKLVTHVFSIVRRGLRP